ncbi:BTB/POZ domain-containing protein KCTD6 [Holothuria leucospilota]|uniref:BTB/POZ domain-containing protein KCTD6 n=1 Tax=Holothuria leucospilota TaxID=206669 RepID=A0A9Q1BKY2_HOLLE|nr:BTB/POZ domain-containing protein KCTD6 [Holothuria leucospilota]
MASTSKKRKSTEKEQKKNVQKGEAGCVVLNVGGTKYMTSEDTLKDLNLGDDEPLVTDREGNIFIDRDGVLFRYILSYLRSNKEELHLPDEFLEHDALEAEAKFFGLTQMAQGVIYKKKNVRKAKAGCVVLNVGGTKYMTSEDTLKDLNLSDEELRVTDREGNIFIDRDGTHFRFILNYLRSNKEELHLPEDFLEYNALEAEAKFFGLTRMAKSVIDKKVWENEYCFKTQLLGKLDTLPK